MTSFMAAQFAELDAHNHSRIWLLPWESCRWEGDLPYGMDQQAAPTLLPKAAQKMHRNPI